MKVLVYLFFRTRDLPWPVVKKVFDESGCHKLSASGPQPDAFYSAKFKQGDPSLDQLRNGLRRLEIDWSERRENTYSKSELETAPFLWLWVRTAEKGMGGPWNGTEYDLSMACSSCGTGAKQLSPLFLKRSEVPKQGSVFQTLDHDILLSPELASALTSAGITGVDLRVAVSHKDRTELPWVQVLARYEMPPVTTSSRGIVRYRPCPVCQRDGYYHNADEPLELVYDSRQVIVDELSDVTFTYERFGRSVINVPFGKSHFARPLVLVKPSVYRVFRDQKVKGVQFVPVTIKEP